MTIYRGPGGGGNADSDAEINALTALTNQSLAYSEAAALEADAAAASAAAAALSAGNTATSEGNALASANAAAASYDSFDDRYLGSKSSPPTLDNDSNTLLVGALYWNTTSNNLWLWTGSAWTQAALTAANFVTVVGDQTVAGVKTFTSSPVVSALTASQAVFTDGSKSLVSNAITGTGNVVMSTSPTLVTPILGTPTSGNFSIGTFTWPTFNQNTTGTAANVTGIVAVANGGTGSTTAAAALVALGERTGATGALVTPTGTTAQRPTGVAGYLRFNTTLAKPEVYNGTAWGSVGGGATGGGSDEIFIENGQTVNTNYTIGTSRNAMSTGPITVASGVSVTIPTGSRWVVI